MRKGKALFIPLIIILSVALLPDFVLGMKKVAQSKLQFLKLEMGARAIALGGAYSAISGDPNCIFYNPAGIAFVDGLAAVFNRSQWISGSSYQSAAVAYNVERIGVFALDYMSVNYGSFERTVVDAHSWEGYQSLGSFDVGEYAFGLGYARQITDRFFIGGQVKYAYQKLGTSQIWEYVGSAFEASKEVNNETDVVAYDFGTFYNSGFKNLSIGIAIQNFANQPIPLNFRFGMAVDVNKIFFPSWQENRLTFSYDIMHPRDYTERMQYGLEFQYQRLLALRGGYKVNYDEQGLTGGVGVMLKALSVGLNIDYAFNDFGAFGLMHRFSMGLAF